MHREENVIIGECLNGKGIVMMNPLGDELFNTMARVEGRAWLSGLFKNDAELHIDFRFRITALREGRTRLFSGFGSGYGDERIIIRIREHHGQKLLCLLFPRKKLVGLSTKEYATGKVEYFPNCIEKQTISIMHG